MTESRISVVLPVYNEGDNIVPCLRGIADALEGHEHEILVAYDFDEDTTLAAIEAMEDRPHEVHLVRNDLGRGPANAIRAGFAAATGDVVVVTMADLSDPPDRIPAMADKVRAGAAVVSGSRYMPGGSQSGGPLLKGLFSRWAGWLLRKVAGMGTSDPTNNFRAYSQSFLERVQVESQTGFDIALELTCKAHLLGERIDEVPSSWIDRSAGESRFRMWAWMPKYLRWFGRAVAAPVVVALLAPILALALWHRELRELDPLGVAFALALSLGPALLFVLAARAARGRTRLVDALHLLVWTVPWTAAIGEGPFRLHRVLASLFVLALAPGFGRAARARLARRLPGQATLMALLFGAVYLLRNYSHGHPTAEPVLDPTWRQAMGYALKTGIPFGPGICFTYGPYGYFSAPAYDPDLYWLSQVGWEFGMRALIAGMFGFALMRVRGAVDRTLCAIGLLASTTVVVVGQLLLMVWLTRWLIERWRRPADELAGDAVAAPRGPSAWAELGTYFLFAVFGMTKFPNFVFAVLCTGLVAVMGLCSGGGWRGLGRTVGLALLAILGAWVLAGQNPLHLPEWTLASWHIADVYSETNGWIGSPKQLDAGITLLWVAEAALLVAFLRAPRLDRGLVALAAAAYLFLAFKAGFTRHFANCLVFFSVAPLAVYVLADGAGPAGLGGWALRAVEVGLRSWVLVFGVLFWAEETNGHAGPYEIVSRLFNGPAGRAVAHWNQVADRRVERARLDAERLEIRRRYELPRIARHVGDRPVDVMGYNQAIAMLNDLNWRPRPIFQSYSTYGSPLMLRNARFLESERAPDFVMIEAMPFDFRFEGCEDAAAMQVVLRDYAPVMMERGFLLWERRPDAPREPDREVLLERNVPLDEIVDLGGLVEGEDAESAVLVLYLDYEFPLEGKLRKALLRSPHLWIHFETEAGQRLRRRVFPSMFAEGALVTPYLATLDQWVRWSAESEGQRMVRFRLETDEAEGLAEYLPTRVQVRVERARELERDPPPADVARALRYSMFEDAPDEVVEQLSSGHEREREVHYLRVHANTTLRYRLGPGTWRVGFQYGMMSSSYTYHGRTDGAEFAVVWVDAQGNERDLHRRLLEPRKVDRDKLLQLQTLEFEARGEGTLEFRTGPGPSRNPHHDLCLWSGIAIDRAEP